ncbi:hypothetical protein HDU91_001808, partial [Kappamyces sp. JEL0680]
IVPAACGLYYFVGGQQQADIADQMHARAILESQALLKKYYCSRLGLTPKRVIVTGGGAQNDHLVQITANVFGVSAYRLETGCNSASLGACYRALHAAQQGSFEKVLETAHQGFVLACTADSKAHAHYNTLPMDSIMETHFSQ